MPEEIPQTPQQVPQISLNDGVPTPPPVLPVQLAPVTAQSAPAAQVSFSLSGDGSSSNGQNGNGQGGINLGEPPPALTLSSLLGQQPLISKHSEEEKEQKRAKLGKTVLSVAAVAALGVYGFFYSQLNPEFTVLSDTLGPNVASQFESSNAELRSKQSELNVLRYRTARLLLDEINGKVDSFQQESEVLKSPYATKIEKTNAEANRQVLGAEIKKSFLDLQKILREPLGVETYTPKPVTPDELNAQYETALLEQLEKEKSALSSSENPDPVQVRLVENVVRLVSNRAFRDTVLRQNVEKIYEDEFTPMLIQIREQGTDELAFINQLKKQRVDWSRMIRDIHAVTTKADPLYGRGLFKTVGGFLFSSYQSDAKSGRVSMSGLTKRSDSRTFSQIVELVDAIEKSPKFKDIDFRSFAKSKAEGGDYSSSLNLEFTRQKEDEKDPRDEVILSENPPAAAPEVGEPERAAAEEAAEEETEEEAEEENLEAEESRVEEPEVEAEAEAPEESREPEEAEPAAEEPAE